MALASFGDRACKRVFLRGRIREHLRVGNRPDFPRPSRQRHRIVPRHPLIVGRGALGVGEIMRGQRRVHFLHIAVRARPRRFAR